MNRQMVSSSRIASVGWENDVMEVQFHNGSIYQYYNVSNSEYQSFLSSSSLGHALSVLDKQHPYKRIV